MENLTLTLATLKGKAEAMKATKAALDGASAAIAQLQSATAQETAATVAQVLGYPDPCPTPGGVVGRYRTGERLEA